MPGQTGLVPAMGPGVAGTGGLTIIGILLLVAVVGDAQGAFEVTITCTISPFIRDDVVNVGLLVPAFTLFTCH